MNEKTYSRKEVSRILSQTLERQKQLDVNDETGLTEKELFQIAEESGLDKNALQETLLNFRAEPEESALTRLLGSSRIHHIQMLNGEINDDIWEEIKIELKGALGGTGTTRKSGKAYEMEHIVDEMGFKSLSLIPKNGSTRFEYSEDWAALKVLISIIFGVVSAGISLVFLKDLGVAKAISLLFAAVGGIFGAGLGLGFLRVLFNAQKKKLSKVVKIISDRLRSQNNPQITIEEEAYSPEQESESETISKLKTNS